jgi:lipopolysaccharide/colanic/teichoic acid biosynthesis glycosyltransferase
VETFYVKECIPTKIRLNLLYAEQTSLWSDTKIILETVLPFLRFSGCFASKKGQKALV